MWRSGVSWPSTLAGLTGHIFDLDMRGIKFSLQDGRDGLRCDAGAVGFGSGLGVGRCGHGEKGSAGGSVEDARGGTSDSESGSGWGGVNVGTEELGAKEH